MPDAARILLAGGAAVAFALGAAALAVLHLLPTRVDPIRDAVSDYGRGPYRAYYVVQVVAIGLGALLLTVVMAVGLTAGAFGLLLLAAFGLCRIGIAAFPADIAGQPGTRRGRVHVALAAVAFTAIAIAAPLLSIELAAAASWRTVGAFLIALAAAVPTALVATYAAATLTRLRGIFGALERLFYVAAISWLMVVAVQIVAAGSQVVAVGR
jgi:hypothetical protein